MGKPLNRTHAFCRGSAGGRKRCSPYWMLRVLRLVGVAGPGRALGGFAECFSEPDGVPRAVAGSLGPGSCAGRCQRPARRQGEEQSLRLHGRYPGKAGWHLPEGRAALEGLPPAMQGWAVGCRAEHSWPLSSINRPHSRLGSAGGGCG